MPQLLTTSIATYINVYRWTTKSSWEIYSVQMFVVVFGFLIVAHN